MGAARGPRLREFAIVGLGAGLGSLARAGIAWVHLATLGPGFPWATLAVNVAGSFLIGLAAATTVPGGRLPASADMRNFVLAGFCGGFTTFSIFGLETILLVEAGEGARAGLYVGASILGWLAAAWLGMRAGEALNARPRSRREQGRDAAS